MADFKDKLSKKLADAQSKFDKLEGERKQLASQRADLDRAIAVKMEELVRLQGDFRTLGDLLECEGQSKDKKK